MKIAAIVGTNAKKSYNRDLLKFMKKHFEDLVSIDILEINEVPMFNENSDQSDHYAVQQLYQAIEMADGVIISTPEHNHSIPSSLKSTLEWLSFNLHPFDNKPVMIVGASYDVQGSSRAQLHLRQVLDAPGMNALVMPGGEFLLGTAHQAFDEIGNLKDSETVAFLESCLKKFIRFAEVASLLSVPEEVNFTPGVYEVSAPGHNGELPMIVTISEQRIEEIKIDSSGETEGIATVVFERIPNEIIEGQTLNVDVISGASVTTNGIVDGVSEAIKLSGADPEILKKRPKVSQMNKLQDLEYKTDVVVIGAGGAGLAAAATVLQEGKQVIVAEKFPSIGGNTVRTGGPMNAAHPTWQNQFEALSGEDFSLEAIQKIEPNDIDREYREDLISLQEQIQLYFDKDSKYLFDSVLFHRLQTYLGGCRTDLKGNYIYGDYELVKTLTDGALPAIEWLQEIGVEFDMNHVEMPVGAMWRRGHKPIANEGYAYIKALENFVNDHDGQIITDLCVKEILMDNGKATGIIGVKENSNQRVIIYADAVILTTGGFGSNTKMLQEYNTYWPSINDDIKTSNSPAITGDGINLGKAVGADLVGMGFSQMLPTCDPETGALFTGLQVPPANFMMVTPEGQRFVNEYGTRDEISKAALENGGLFYLIADQPISETAYNTNSEKIEKEVQEGVLYRADSLEELAQQLGMDATVLIQQVTLYNQYVDVGYDSDYGKNVFDLKIEKAPFYATPRQPAVHHTMGGLKINSKAQVIDETGVPIHGLYAAGEVAGGIHAGNRLGGNSLTDIFTFGRIAGKSAVDKEN